MSGEQKSRRSCSGCKVCLASVAVVVLAIRVALCCPAAPLVPDTTVHLTEKGWEKKLQSHLEQYGYAHVARLINRTEAEELRAMAQDFCYGEKRKALPLTWGGYSVPAFLDLEEFKRARWLLADSRLHQVLSAMFKGTKYRYASHNDVGCDFVGVWHKDILRGPQKKYQVHDLWKPDDLGERHEIYKVLFYLQDHLNDERSVKVIPGSHAHREMSLDKGYVAVHPEMGDAVIIDQRISHAGNQFYSPFGQGRLFIQVGFGKANIFTDEFERGTVERQKGYQAKMLQKSQARGLETVMADVKFTAIGLLFSALPPQFLNMMADIDVKKYALLGKLIFGANAANATTK